MIKNQFKEKDKPDVYVPISHQSQIYQNFEANSMLLWIGITKRMEIYDIWQPSMCNNCSRMPLKQFDVTF